MSSIKKANKQTNAFRSRAGVRNLHQSSGGTSHDKTSIESSNCHPAKQCPSIHRTLPDFQHNQSQLFFECTLFLYSILVLFLQYINLYKTLWWLPKSHWPYSLKYYLINPYLLSCIGLVLGSHVTKRFWDTISERVNFFSKNSDGLSLIFWKTFEYSIIKTPLVTVIATSFIFSFTRIYAEFNVSSLFYFFYPFCIYTLLFLRNVFIQIKNVIQVFFARLWTSLWTHKIGNEWKDLFHSFSQVSLSSSLIDIDSASHNCCDNPQFIHVEAKKLLADSEVRFLYCIFAGLFTAYFSIVMPRAFAPVRTISGEQQYMLINDVWIIQLAIIVSLTAFSLYAAYLFPISYLDLLYRCAVHLGCWEQISQPKQNRSSLLGPGEKPLEQIPSLTEEQINKDSPHPNGRRIIFDAKYFEARSHPEHKTVLALPENRDHFKFYCIAKDPVRTMTYMCIFQAVLIAFQYWLLLLTTDWQHIMTLVLLMFANYLLLAKAFKDRIVIGRIYKPSGEDKRLINRLTQCRS